MISPNSRNADKILCHGITCDVHQDCQRYTKADGALNHIWWIATCLRGAERPLFVPVARDE